MQGVREGGCEAGVCPGKGAAGGRAEGMKKEPDSLDIAVALCLVLLLWWSACDHQRMNDLTERVDALEALHAPVEVLEFEGRVKDPCGWVFSTDEDEPPVWVCPGGGLP